MSDMLAFAAVSGSTLHFITHGFKENAKRKKRQLAGSPISVITKTLYLEIIDMTFSIEGVLGAWRETEWERSSCGSLRRETWKELKGTAVFHSGSGSFFVACDGFGAGIPQWISPLVAFVVVGFFFARSG
jgi:uncharacterized protein